MRELTKYPERFTRKDYRKFEGEELDNLLDSIIDAMTMEEKMEFLGGSNEPEDKGKIGNAGYQWGVPRLGIPESVLYDGPAGVTGIVETTGLPQPVLLGSTWDEDLAYEFGRVAASENAACSGNYQLSPQVDTIHSPHFGRNKDMKSEDSYLVSKLSVAETKATQDENVIATVKHFSVANSFGDFGPGNMPDNRVDEQTLHETYLRPFEETVKYGGAGSMMNSYNKVNGKYTTNNDELNIDVLRDQWGYKGSVMSDWGSVHEFTLNAGMDLEMPYSAYNDKNRILKHIRKGDLTFEQVDDAVRHILWGMNSAGLLGLVQVDENGRVKEDPEHTHAIEMEWRFEEEVNNGLLERNREVAEKIIEEGTILLKNDNQTLPLLDPGKMVAVGLGAKYPICGQQQERSFGQLERMVSGATALSEEFGEGVECYPAIDYLGETIPADVLFKDADCKENGIIRTAGIREEDSRLKDDAMSQGGAGAAFMGVNTFDEDGERVSTGLGIWKEKKTEIENLGEVVAIDPVIDFSTKSKNYKNAEGGNAFENGSYTWKTFLKIEKSGSYNLKLHCIGGNATFLINIDGEWKLAAESRTRENTQWPWDAAVCTDTGMGLNGTAFGLEAGHVYPIVVFAEHTVIGKDLQIRLAWSTPDFREKNYKDAMDACAKADTIILYALNSEENESQRQIIMGSKRRNCDINQEQERLIKDVIEAKKKDARLVVIVQTSNAIATDKWADKVDAILTAYHTGQEGSRVLAKILSGRVNPSGKLSQTWPKNSYDTPLSDTEEHYNERYGGFEGENGEIMTRLSEGIFFGYRWNDKYGIEPQFAFGHGLSYTEFEYDNISVTKKDKTFDVSLDIINVGQVPGDEIVQVYLGKAEVPNHIQMAEKQLAGFMRVRDLVPGEMRHITIEIDERGLSYWDPCAPMITREDNTKDKWVRAVGRRKVLVGASSRDIRLEADIDVK
ncbi:MAG: glycoside hydrolase family 3 C-terminal domain-containing protein [Lachnospiraceae bacterium]|nr:glycoside hydrolase family 3 C-terminal domain-containing protein [Lachnospiraceae bacterium]